MKTKLHLQPSAFSFRPFTFALLATFTLFTFTPCVPAQDTTNISAADFQRLVYSAQLHTDLALKPELEASLQVLLEMQRRNPNADPAALVNVLTNALQIYRTNAVYCYIRTNGFRDEVLAAYLDALRQVPAHTNFVPINLTILDNFMLGPADYPTNGAISDVIDSLANADNQRLFASAGEALKRQALVDDCVARAQRDGAFATAMDTLLYPESGVWLGETPAEIIGDTNSPLHDDFTMTNLLAWSESSGNGSVTVSSNQLINLFTGETQIITNAAQTDLQVLAQINQNQSDLLAYLNDSNAIAANEQLQAVVLQGQPARLACASAAVLVQSKLASGDSDWQKNVREGAEIASSACELTAGLIGLCSEDPAKGIKPLLSGSVGIFNLMAGGTAEDATAQELGQIKSMIGDLSTNMNYRFDRVDQSLDTIFETMNTQFGEITNYFNDQNQEIAQLTGNVDAIHNQLVTAQASLDRLEQDIFQGFTTSERNQYIVNESDGSLFYALKHNGQPMSYAKYASDIVNNVNGYEGDFWEYAAAIAHDETLSPYLSLDLNEPDLYEQLTNWPLEANLNYLKQFLSSQFKQSTADTTGGRPCLSNPTEWFKGAYCLMQLDLENPMLFRGKGTSDVPTIIGAGQDIDNFCASLTFSGNAINWSLWNALENYYSTNLTAFNQQVWAAEETNAIYNHNFNVDTWRQWDIAAPRVTATNTAVLVTSPRNVIAAGEAFSLALKPDGTVAGWGDDSAGQTDIPSGLTNVVAVAAGASCGLALEANGTVVSWGASRSPNGGSLSFDGVDDQVAVTNQSALNAYPLTIEAWIRTIQNDSSQAGIISKYSPGSYNGYNLFLANGHLHAWYLLPTYPQGYQGVWDGGNGLDGGFVADGQWHFVAFTVGPTNLSGGPAVGQLYVDGVLKDSMPWTFDGTPGPPTTSQELALGNYPGQGYYRGRLDDVRIWNWVRTVLIPIQFDMMNPPTGTESGLIAYWKFDEGAGTTAANSAVVTGSACDGQLNGPTWVPGWFEPAPLALPAGLTNVVAIAAGGYHSLALKADGTVVGWGDNTTIPSGLTHVAAIAAGRNHSLAFKSDGTVAAWGDNTYGQTTMPPGLNNVVAIAAGDYHNLALKADGTVVGWGDNLDGQATGVTDGPAGAVKINGATLANVVAIAAGEAHSLAVKSDGTVVGWGAGNPATAGHALSFNGTNSYVQLNRPVQDDFTIEFWFRSTQVAGSEAQWWNGMGLVDGEVAGVMNDFGVSFGNGKVLFGTGNPDVTIRSSTALADGQWHQVAATRQKASGTITLFVDGVVNCLTNTGNTNSLTSPTQLRLGSLHTDAGFFQGQLDEVRIWNVDRSQNEIAVDMDGPLTGTEPGLVAYFKLDEGSGTMATNSASAGSVYNGTLVNGPAWVASPIPFQGQATPPAGLGSVVGISAGGAHSVALKADGSIVAWGDNSFGQTSVPLSLLCFPFLRSQPHIAAGQFHGLVVKADGTVVGWGAGTPGTSGDPNYGQATIPFGLTNVVAVAAGGLDSLALTADGTVYGWGYDLEGEADSLPPSVDWAPYYDNGIVPGLSNVVAVAAGFHHSLALKADGTVVGWGENDHGEATGTTNDAPGAVNVDGQTLSNVVAIAAGDYSSFALKTDGAVVAWGDKSYNQATTPTNVFDLDAWGEYPPGLAVVPPVTGPITAVAFGSAHCLALTADGLVVGWGLNTWGQTNVPIEAQSGIQAVSAGFGHSLALTTNGCVLAWGLNDCGQTNVPVGAHSGVVVISAGGKHNLALKTDGTVAAWGLNDCGQTNVPDGPGGIQGQVVAIAAGGEHSLALLDDGSVRCWGDNDDGQAPASPGLINVVAIAAGRYHSLALTSAGQVVAWGLNASGQCTVPVAAQSGVVAIAAGKIHSAALKADGSVVVWGSGPVTVLPPQAGNNVVAIAAGDQDTLLLSANTSTGTSSVQPVSLVLAQIPAARLMTLLSGDYDYVNSQISSSGTALYNACRELTGARMLLADVLELGMSYTLESDGILHGFLYGNESLADQGSAPLILQTAKSNLLVNPYSPPQLLGDVAALRFQCFTNRLNHDLANLTAPQIPRLVGHTLRLLNLLNDAWAPTDKTPPPALEWSSVSNRPSVLLYGEPYVNYTLQSCCTLSSPNWTNTANLDCQDGQVTNTPVSSGPQGFYRAMTVVPPMQ